MDKKEIEIESAPWIGWGGGNMQKCQWSKLPLYRVRARERDREREEEQESEKEGEKAI